MLPVPSKSRSRPRALPELWSVPVGRADESALVCWRTPRQTSSLTLIILQINFFLRHLHASTAHLCLHAIYNQEF